MEKITGFFNNLLKKNLDISQIGGLDGLLTKVGELSKEGKVDVGMLKKLVMPYAGNFMPNSLKQFFADNKDKKEVDADTAIDFLKKNMKEEAPAAAPAASANAAGGAVAADEAAAKPAADQPAS